MPRILPEDSQDSDGYISWSSGYPCALFLVRHHKHPEIEGKEAEVKECLRRPVEVRKSSEDSEVSLHYKKEGSYFLCVVVRHLDGEGFIITAYITDKIKEGETVWKK